MAVWQLHNESIIAAYIYIYIHLLNEVKQLCIVTYICLSESESVCVHVCVYEVPSDNETHGTIKASNADISLLFTHSLSLSSSERAREKASPASPLQTRERERESG